MQIVAYKHALPITKSSNCRYEISRVQSSSVEKRIFFSSHHNPPEYEEMGLFSKSAARPFVTYLRRGDRRQLPALNQSEDYLHVRCNKPTLRRHTPVPCP